MYSLRVNRKTKTLVEEVADMVGLPVSEILRRTARKMQNGKLIPIDENTIGVQQTSSGNVINFFISANYHKELGDFLTVDMPPIPVREWKVFRSCLIAACLDSRGKAREQHDRIARMNRELAEYTSQAIAERRALYAEVM